MDLILNDKFQNPAMKQVDEAWKQSRRTLNSLIDCFYKRAKLEECYASQLENICKDFPLMDFDKTYIFFLWGANLLTKWALVAICTLNVDNFERNSGYVKLLIEEMNLKKDEANKCAISLKSEAEEIKNIAKLEHKKYTDAKKQAQDSDESLTKAMAALNNVSFWSEA